MNTTKNTVAKKYTIWIWILSIAIPIAVAVLFTIRIPGVERLGFLPPIYASINALTALLLIVAVIMVRNGKLKIHENLYCTFGFIFGDVCCLSHDFRCNSVWWRRCPAVCIFLYTNQSYSIVYWGYSICVNYVRKSYHRKLSAA